jgi:hypothetical protein
VADVAFEMFGLNKNSKSTVDPTIGKVQQIMQTTAKALMHNSKIEIRNFFSKLTEESYKKIELNG